MPGRPEWAGLHTKELEGAVRLFPHRIAGEGHFVCLLRRVSMDADAEKRGKTAGRPGRLNPPTRAQWADWEAFREAALTVEFPAERLRVRGERLYLVPEEMPDFGNLRLVHPGVWVGTFKTGRFEPAHPLALFLRPGGARRTLDLSPGDPALAAYLRGEPLTSAGEAGWLLVTVDGWPLGWGKRVGAVVKNHYPRGWMG